ncbi:MAG TPA: serine/threonine-protein kinase [Burkholderiales bacterium]|nr:serine/threonine-protein kinase [Burkholderiales bacterium]
MATPNRLGKYEITEVLGRGAMGVVYKGFDPGIRRTVAIKTIRRELIEGERPAAAMLARFRNEAQAAGKLAHPGIVAVYDYGEDASVAYIAMEYVEGNSLREYLGRNTRFEERDAVSVMSQLLEALQHAHERRVWHRDIKPANIIVMMNGRVKVADFGIARIEASELTQTGAMLGSPGYMAPEQYAAAAIDHRADLFAAGVVFYQLVTGAKPFIGTPEQISYATCHGEAMRPSLADPGKGWERYDPVVSKALAKRPEDRFQTADAFRAAILAAHAAPAAPAVSEETIIVEVLRPAAAVDLSSVPSRAQSLAPGPSAGPAAAGPARHRAWAIGSAIVVVVAIGVAAFAVLRTGWLAPARPSPEVEAQLAKARAEAEEAKRRAETEAAAAAEAKRQLELERAAEAKLANTRAETRDTKRRAQTEAAPRKEDARLAAATKNREPSPKPAAAAQEKAAPAQTLPSWLWSSAPPAGTAQEKARPAAEASRYDGAWTATRSCDAFEEFPAQVQNWAFTVKAGEFVVERGTASRPGHNLVRGKPGDDGNLVLSGTGINSAQRLRGKPYPAFFEGRLDGDRFVMKGRLGQRACTLVLARG